jgi:hypothetical protein
MPPGRLPTRGKIDKERRTKPARRSLAFNRPRPPLLEDFTKESEMGTPKTKPSEGDSVATSEGLLADAFFGASPVVASALGIRLGATPCGPIDSNPLPLAISACAPRLRQQERRPGSGSLCSPLQAHLV